MDDLIRQAIAILRGMWQRRWVGVIVAWIVGVAAALAILRMPDKYEASARIYVDTQSVLKPLMSGLAVQPNVNQQILILSRTLISRPNVEKLIRMADLDLGVTSKEGQSGLVEGLMGALQIKSAGKDNLYTLSYQDAQPERARRVVQSLVSIFVESSLGDKRKDADSAKQFISDQIRIYEYKLEEAENRLKEFKLRNMEGASSDGKDYFTRMAELSGTLNQARLELREAENARDSLRRQVSGEEPSIMGDAQVPNANGASVPEIDGRLEAQKRNLDNLLQRYTEQHPDVIWVRRVIADLEAQKREEVAARMKAGGPMAASVLETNPVYQQLRVSLAEAEANVASLGARVSEYEARHARLKEAMRMVPQIEAEFAQLNRDYAIHKKNYESLVSRREAATLSGEMEASGVVDFRLIDPPRVSPQPVAPNRMLLLPLALLGAIGVGLFSSFAASQIRPTFLDSRALREISGAPVLGTVSLIVSEPARRRERRGLVGFFASALGLVAVYGAGLAVMFLFSARAV